ncbi:MAG: methyltransferase domain-containing protein [Alphaproteobacteria bacterium]|nr:methyltransferase domain-containing protein [Alphaproteobacteria bacterium]
MRDGGKIDAAIVVLNDVLNQRTPVKDAVRDWGKRSRFAGARDRAWISGLALDALRRKNSIEHAMEAAGPRPLAIGALKHAWGWDVRKIEEAFRDDHAPAALTGKEREALLLAPDPSAPANVQGDYPEWLTPHMERAFGPDAVIEAQAMAMRAPVDLRINTLKSDPEKAGRALESVKAKQIPELINGFRIPPPQAMDRGESVEAIPAYSKGWVEVQDMGSQIAAAASCAAPGEQVLDYCAGGGGKTIAMAAMMANKGQIFAHDVDGRRLSALIPRMERAGIRNVQLRHPRENASLDDLSHAMDLVMIDAPCTGTGTWRRKPDAKWRLSEQALRKRMQEQGEILRTACNYVKPGGRLVYVTCSFLMEENEDQVASFLDDRKDFIADDAAECAVRSGQLTDKGAALVRKLRRPAGSVRLTPRSAGSDGFFMAVMRRAG